MRAKVTKCDQVCGGGVGGGGVGESALVCGGGHQIFFKPKYIKKNKNR
jgi:hypothetical protein